MKINEIFYSLQGEGHYTGTPAIFIRLAQCNLKCDFCDTLHEPFVEMTEDEILKAIEEFPANHVVLTGGEPTLQLTETLLDLLHQQGKYIQIETNGSYKLKEGIVSKIDWITCSPKFEFCSSASVQIARIDELKVVYQGQNLQGYDSFKAKEYYLQPCDVKDIKLNKRFTNEAIEYIKANPKWKLSIQTHKILNVQ